MEYQAPSIEVVSSDLKVLPANRAVLYIQTKKAPLPASIEALVPGSLKNHPAIRGERGAKLVLHGQGAQANAPRIILGAGAGKDFTAQEAAEWGENAGQTLLGEWIEECQVHFGSEVSRSTIMLNFAKGMMLGGFKVDELKTKSDSKKPALKKLWIGSPSEVGLTKADFQMVSAIAEGIAFARTLTELPFNAATPEMIVERFQKRIDPKLIQLEIWDEKKIDKKKMGLIQAVGKSAPVPPRLLIARYGRDLTKKSPLYLVGKGVTFDTGGINLKTVPWRDLLSMKGDMAGAAAVLGAMLAIMKTRPAVPVVAIAPLVMNGIGSNAVIPGDVVKSYSGKTVEIQNTDAEGRLILADALTLAVEEKAAHIVDVATLTGACAIALGLHNSGLFSNHEDFQTQVKNAALQSGEPAWPMPMSARYGEELKSNVADLSNMGKGRDGGATLGAKFLENFVENTPWCHLDIAGSSDLGSPAAGGTQHKSAGRMVHTLVTLAHEMADKQRKKS